MENRAVFTGYKKLTLPKMNNLDIATFSRILDIKNLTNSYKIYWFYGILEEIKLGKKEITFEKIIYWMIVKSWYTILEYKLNFGKSDKLSEAVKELCNKYSFHKNINENDLLKKLEEIDSSEFYPILNFFSSYVPYRLLAPFYSEELRGEKDTFKNKLIIEFSTESDKSIYRLENKIIIVNKNWFDYLSNNQKIIEGWLIGKLINFLQTRNPNIPNIPFKLFAPKKRDLSKVTKIWKEMIKEKDIIDIYSNKKLLNDISIDHFLPWSFVLHDQLWNLVPTTRSINSSKSDNLPNLGDYLELFCTQQFQLYIFLKEKNYNKALEDYFQINLDSEDKINKETFTRKLKDNIMPLFQIAKNQGFQSEWQLQRGKSN